MSRKEAGNLDAAWRALQEICEARGRFVTAGEFAKHYGVARNTAFKLLMKMLEMEAIEYRQTWRRTIPVYFYGTAGIPAGNEK